MFDYTHLSALAAVIRTGGFDKAAVALNVTPSAISQRIKTLEERVGTVLVVRGQPCVGTDAGNRLCRHVERVALLENRVRGDLSDLASAPGAEPMPTIRIAINADSLATWFMPAMAAVGGTLFDIVLDDQDHSADWLRRGDVSAAVTAFGPAVQGCDSRPLGALRYRATASPDFVLRWCPDGFDANAAARAPCLTFNRKDRLQTNWLLQCFGTVVSPPTHWLPSTRAFVDASRAGLGWGMNPEVLVADDLRAGRLVELLPDRPFDTPLYWQANRVVADALAPLTTTVRQAARAVLIPPTD